MLEEEILYRDKNRFKHDIYATLLTIEDKNKLNQEEFLNLSNKLNAVKTARLSTMAGTYARSKQFDEEEINLIRRCILLIGTYESEFKSLENLLYTNIEPLFEICMENKEAACHLIGGNKMQELITTTLEILLVGAVNILVSYSVIKVAVARH
ncbi:hypothetical protein [Paraclostridium bifermentans]|uniref:hypothetical protein n=1 Tax=Paraclostridium bifermentans TaxID=1490 RepID=UPI00374F5FB9